jgi:hypothetical protein
VENFKYLGVEGRDKIFAHEETKSRLNSVTFFLPFIPEFYAFFPHT